MKETEDLKDLIRIIKERIEICSEEASDIKVECMLSHCYKRSVINEKNFLKCMLDYYLNELLEFFVAFERGSEESALL